MNKCLLRKLKPFLLSVEPQNARQLIQAFDFLATTVEKGYTRFWLLLRAFRLITQDRLSKQGFSESQLFQETSKFEAITEVWLEELATLLVTFFSPAILLLLFLEATLGSNLVPERQKLVFEEIKPILTDRHWPPQRQRCDFICTRSTSGAVSPMS